MATPRTNLPPLQNASITRPTMNKNAAAANAHNLQAVTNANFVVLAWAFNPETDIDALRIVATSTPVQVDLPKTDQLDGRVLWTLITADGVNTVTIENGDAGDTIEGSTSKVYTANAKVGWRADATGTNWEIFID